MMTAVEFGDFERRRRENEGAVYQIAYGVLSNAADAEDVTQDVFIHAYRKAEALREPAKFRAWVGRIARRLALNHLRDEARSRQREQLWFESAPQAYDVEREVAERDFHEHVGREIDRLPEKLRNVLILSAHDEMPSGAVATLLAIPEGTVRSRLHLARKRLLRALVAAGALVLFPLLYVEFRGLDTNRIDDASLSALSAWQSPTQSLLVSPKR